MRASSLNLDACPLSVHKLIHAKPNCQGEPDALMDPRRRQPFKEAGARQTGEVHEIAASASAREARAGLLKTLTCEEIRHTLLPDSTCLHQTCLITPVPDM